MTIIRPTTINARFSQPVGLGGEKLWLCPTLGGDRLDLSGNGNHGTYNGGMGTVVDKYKGDRAYEFDGSNDYINLGSVLTGTGDFTISAWFHTNSTSFSYIYGKGVEGRISDGIGISQQGSFYGAIGNNSTRIVLQNSGSVSTATWYHYAVTFDRDGVATKYVNGMPIGSDSIVGAAGNIGSDNDYIGRFGSTTAGFFNGKIDDVRAYNRVLNPSEIKHLASKRGVLGSPRKPYDPFKRTVVRVPAATPTATKVGSFKKPTTIIKPSYQAGYARNASESENPQLWDGLVGAWSPSMGDCGKDLNDLSGRGNHAELIGRTSIPQVTIRRGIKSIHMDGNADAYRVSRVGDFSPKNVSFCAWVGDYGDTSGNRDIGGVWRQGKRSWVLRNVDGYPKFYTSPDGTTINVNTTSDLIPFPDFTNICCVHDGSSAKIFQDGKLTASYAASYDLFSSQTEMCIGAMLFYDANSPLGGYTWNGFISQQLVYNRALSPTEIKQLYVDSLAPFRKKQRVSVAVPAAVTPSATYHPLRSLAHPLEQ